MGMSDETRQKDDQMDKADLDTSSLDDIAFDDMSEEELAQILGEAGVADLEDDETTPLKALAEENHRQEAEISDLKDQLMRMAAEMENLRRRTQKDVSDARSFSISSFARDMLGVSDNLRRAMDHVEEGAKEEPAMKAFLEGIEMTEREFLNALERNGVKKLSPKGEKFDPNFHQAMFEVQNAEVPNNSVMEVVQDGYVIGERVLRPAMVGVAKGGPKQSTVSPAEDDLADSHSAQQGEENT